MGKRPSQAKGTTPPRHGEGEKRGKRQDDHAPPPSAHGDTSGPWGPIPYILTIWCVSRVLLAGIGVGARSWIGQVNTPGNIQHAAGIGTGHAWLDIWGAWDSRWYYYIADVGYLVTPTASEGHPAWAFFPFYPWMARAVAAVVGDTYVAALLVSNVALLIGAWFFYKLVEQQHDATRARKAVLFLFLFPTAYVFSCLMTEGLFLALSVGAWYYGSRGNWLVAGVLGMGSAMTRLVGLFMAPLLALEYLRQRRWRLVRIRPDALWIGLVPVGLGVFMATGYTLMDNPLQFVEARKAWAPSTENPLWVLWWSLQEAWRGGFALYGGFLGIGYGAISTVAAIVVLLWGRKQIGILLCLWSMAQILISLSIHQLAAESMPRYLAVLFPVFMILASRQMNRVVFVITAVVLSLLQAATFSLWTLGWGVAI